MIESDPTAREGVFASHHLVQSKIIKSIVQGVLVFITEKTMAKMFNLLEIGINKLPPKLIKEKEKENAMVVYQKIVPPKALVN